MPLSPLSTIVLTVLVFLASALYASVGHAGASGDIAAMGLVGVPVASMKPIALILNLFVATIATYKFYRSGYFSSGSVLAVCDHLDPCRVHRWSHLASQSDLSTHCRPCPSICCLSTCAFECGSPVCITNSSSAAGRDVLGRRDRPVIRSDWGRRRNLPLPAAPSRGMGRDTTIGRRVRSLHSCQFDCGARGKCLSDPSCTRFGPVADSRGCNGRIPGIIFWKSTVQSRHVANPACWCARLGSGENDFASSSTSGRPRPMSQVRPAAARERSCMCCTA